MELKKYVKENEKEKNTEPKRIDIAEFRKLGFLQEANRKFFHPVGLALEVVINEDETETLGGIWDYREDEEGIYYGESVLKKERAEYVDNLLNLKKDKRIEMFGSIVQPIK